MANFPSIEDEQLIINEVSRTDTLRTRFEAGYVQTRARFTRIPKRFELNWSRMSISDFGTLRTFYEDTVIGGAESFNWTHPISSTVYVVRFIGDELNFDANSGRFYSGKVVLEEV